MLIRKNFMADERAIGDAETLQLDINYTKPITAIDIKIQMTTGAGVVANTPIPRQVSNISIKDGAFNLVSGIMSALQALQVARNGGKPRNHFEAAASVVNESMVRILFGRYYGDPDYYLDPTRFNNLVIELTAAFTIAATDYATGTGRVSIQPHIIEYGANPYKGVIMQKEVARPTVVASAVSYVDLPVDYDYMQLCYCMTDGTADPDTVNSRVRLDINADELVILDDRVEDLIQQNNEERGVIHVNNDIFLDYAVSNGIGLAPTTTLLDYYCLFGMVYNEFAPAKSDSFLKMQGVNNFRLQLTGGSAGGQTRVIASQVYNK